MGQVENLASSAKSEERLAQIQVQKVGGSRMRRSDCEFMHRLDIDHGVEWEMLTLVHLNVSLSGMWTDN